MAQGQAGSNRLTLNLSQGEDRGARFHEHDLRGKVATDMDDPVAAQKLLGHKDMSMTEDYIKARQTEVVKPHTRRKKE